MNTNVNLNLTWLDGYLNGIFSLSGQNINEYRADTFIFTINEGENLKSSLKAFFAPHDELHIFHIEKMKNNLGGIELEIQNFILEDILGNYKLHADAKVISDRKKYIAFKIMDMIEFIMVDYLTIPTDNQSAIVYRVKAKLNLSNREGTFFCISFSNKVLVLNFTRKT